MKRLITTLGLLLPVLSMAQNCLDGGSGVDGGFVASSDMNLPGGTYNFTSFTINPGVTVSVTGTNPLIIYSTGLVQIDGILKADGGNGVNGVTYTSGGIGGVGVAGGANGGSGSFASGVGPLDGTNGSGTGGTNNKGAGWSGGGGGGYAASGSSSGGVGGFGGPVYGTADLAGMFAGSGGGGGSGGYDCGAGGGGAGGGLIAFYTPSTLTIGIGGIISCNGGNGGTDGTGNCGGGGGGSGGAVLFRVNTLINNGLISAIGGIGGASNVSGSPYYGTGGNGGNGRIRMDYISLSGSGSVTPASGFSAAPLSVTPGSVTATCAADGSASVVINGGTGPINTFWSNGQIFNPATNLTPGNYACYVSDANGCADTVYINVPSLANGSSQTVTICANDSLVVGSSVYTTSGNYSDVLVNAAGCDSTVMTSLTVLPALGNNQSFTICEGETVTVGNSVYDQSGTYTDVLSGINGCDSTITTTLSVLAPITSTQSFTICEGESITVGNSVYTQAGTYMDAFTSIEGCDSTVTTQLTVNSITATAAISNSQLTASPAGQTTYQWYNCTTNTPVAGATSATFIPAQNGQYAVIIGGTNNCSDTSDCITYSLVGTEELTSSAAIAYPNPTNGVFTVAVTNVETVDYLQVRDMTGRILFTESQITAQKTDIDLSRESNGVYFLHVGIAGEEEIIRMIKQ